MGLASLARAAVGGSRTSTRASIENPSTPLTDAQLVELLGGEPVEAGVAVDAAKALGLTAVYRAVSLVAGTCAGVPLHGYRRDGNERRDVTADHPLLTDPHPELPAVAFWEQVYAALELHGNAFLRKQPTGSRPRYLLPIHPTLVRVGRANDGTKVFEVRTGSGTVPLTSAEVLHIPGLVYDGTVGVGPIDAARQGLGLSLAAEKYGARLFGRGTLISGVLETERRLPPGAADQLKKQWQARVSGLRNSHDVTVLDQGAKFRALTLTPEQAQFLDTRRFGVVEVARLFGVPPVLLMESGDASNWGTGIAEQVRGFLTFSLAQRLQRTAGWVTKALLPRDVWAEHTTEVLLRLDGPTRYRMLETGIRAGILSRAEARRIENLPPGPPELERFEVGQLTAPTRIEQDQDAKPAA